jgi:hypothetical protein
LDNQLAPIVLFVYNRPDHTKRSIEALIKNELASESDLVIYSDEAKSQDVRKDVYEVRKYLDTIQGFKKVTIIKRVKNWGLANSIIDGVTSIVNIYGKIIVLEDDLVTSNYFLKFMNDSLNLYSHRDDIFSVTGYNYPKNILEIPRDYPNDIYLSYRCMSWGWSTWKDRWSKVDWDVKDFKKLEKDKKAMAAFNKGGSDLFPMLKRQREGSIDSWAIRFCYAHNVNNAFCVFPVNSLVNNEGFDGTGVHCGNDKKNGLNNRLDDIANLKLEDNIQINKEIVDNFYKISQKTLFQRTKNFIRRCL